MVAAETNVKDAIKIDNHQPHTTYIIMSKSNLPPLMSTGHFEIFKKAKKIFQKSTAIRKAVLKVCPTIAISLHLATFKDDL